MKKIFLLVLVIMSSFFMLAQTSGYPYGNGGTCGTSAGSDPWLFYKKQCTSFVAFKLNQAFDNSPGDANDPFRNDITGTGGSEDCNSNSGALRHACRWAMRMQSTGYFVSNVPTPGAIAHWTAGDPGASATYGHVAFVESVNADGSASISEYNRTGNCTFGTRNVSAPRYIRYNRFRLESSTLNPNPIVQGQGLTVQVTVKNNHNSSITSNFRCALYSSANQFLGEIQLRNGEVFSANQTKVLTFSKSTISSVPGAYKIWIESRASSSSPWILLHKTSSSSTISVNISAPVATCTVPTTSQISLSNLTKNSARVSLAGTNYRIDLQYRLQNGTWVDVTDTAAAYFNLTGLLTGRTYEVRMRRRCVSTSAWTAYSASKTFTTPVSFTGDNAPVGKAANTQATAFPNPSQGVFTVMLPGDSNAPVTVRLLDAIGKEVHRQQAAPNTTQLTFVKSGLPVGTYTLQITNAAGKTSTSLKHIISD
ncbi:CHAP domain-containing protein [Neolewinella persica]|uniref:CHAP domain-containing protein n=1 Tax=Neolewinella persica TaxID=70998 RepID=UPI00037F955F|nr:CHAP domain-containing protein [Neolewinella persica]